MGPLLFLLYHYCRVGVLLRNNSIPHGMLAGKEPPHAISPKCRVLVLLSCLRAVSYTRVKGYEKYHFTRNIEPHVLNEELKREAALHDCGSLQKC